MKGNMSLKVSMGWICACAILLSCAACTREQDEEACQAPCSTGLSPVLEMATEPSRGLARFSSILPLLATRITCHHPDRSSNSICRSPCFSRTQSRPRHLPWQTKSQRRPSAIA